MTTAREDADALEAIARQIMAQHAAIKPRGFDTMRRREELHRQLDDVLDDIALLRAIDALEAAP